MKIIGSKPLSCCLAALLGLMLGQSDVQAAEESIKMSRDEIRTVLSRMENGHSYNVNFADDAERKDFIEAMMLAGKTPENSPQLYREIEGKRVLHAKKGGFVRKVQAVRPTDDDGPVITEKSINVITGATSDSAKTFQASGLATLRGGSPHTFGLITLHDKKTDEIIGKEKLDNYGAKVNQVNVKAFGPYESVYARFRGYYLDENGNMENFNTKLETGKQVPTITNAAPVSKSGLTSDPTIVCVNRAPNKDNQCQYGKDNFTDSIKFPVTGSISYPVPVQRNASGMPVDGDAVMFLVKETQGGGCIAWGPKTQDFFANANTKWSPDNKKLNWDFGPADFGTRKSCMADGDTLNFTMRITTFDADYNMMIGILSSTPPTEPGPNWKQVSEIKLWVGCMPAGTMVELADGRQVPVETIAAEGEKVRTGNGAILTVEGNTIGVEEEPVTRLLAENGYSVILTGGHPVPTRDHGIKMAKDLRPGDWIITRDGEQQLKSVTPEQLEGDKKVYNIALGTKGEYAPKGSTTFFANGILVGDHNMQAELARTSDHPTTEAEILRILPKQWHQDFLLSRGKGG